MLYMKQSFHKLCQVVLTQPSRMQLVNDGRYVLSGGVGALGLVTLEAIRSAFHCIGCAAVCTELQSLLSLEEHLSQHALKESTFDIFRTS